MKYPFFVLLMITTFSFSAHAEEYFAEFRGGLSDSYHKVVDHEASGKLEGNFSGTNFGLRIGKSFGEHAVFVEHNPEQEVEIKSANELAKVQSTFLGYRYMLESPGWFVGGQIGQSSFELVQGPNGVKFADNPITKGLTYGVNAGYIKHLEHFYMGADFVYNFGKYSESGPSSTPVNNIEIQYQSQINAFMGLRF